MKLIKSLFASLLVASLMATIGGNAQAKTLRFAAETPRSDTQFLGAERFAELLKAKTNGALEVKVFPDGALGTFPSAVAGVRAGTIDFIISGSTSYSSLLPLTGIMDIPFMFKDSAHAYRVLDGKVGQEILDKLGEFGLKGLAYWDNGWRQISNSRGPVTTPADLKGLKMRTTGSPAHIEAFKLLGTTTIPMPLAELHKALEIKTVDAQEHPIGVFWSAKLYEVQKHLSLTYHCYSAIIMVMNKAKFDAMPSAHQKAILESAREAGNYQRKLNNDNIKKIVEDLKKAGIQVVETVDSKPFFEATKPVRKSFTSKFGGESLISEIDAVRDAK